jgi:hypothetical protein
MVQDQEIWPASLSYHQDQSSDLETLGLSGFSHLPQNARKIFHTAGGLGTLQFSAIVLVLLVGSAVTIPNTISSKA